jgi:DNA-binding transcriptional ArsR family regulator
MTTIPEDLRPKAYASLELVLDVLHSLRDLVRADLESIAIYLCVGEATMRPVLADQELVKKLATTDVAPEDVRGSITMLQVADRLDMPRETVRRKVKQLIEKGFLYADDKGRIRSSPNFDRPETVATVNAMHDAVRRYRERLAKFGLNC